MPKVTNNGQGVLQLPSGEFLLPGDSADVSDEHLAWSGVQVWVDRGDLTVEKRGPGRPAKAVEAEADKE